MLLQRSLFPDAFEILEGAWKALDELELDAAEHFVAEARARDQELVQLEELAAALRWLRREAGSADIPDELLALLFTSVPEAVRSGEIAVPTARMIDVALARSGLRRSPAGPAFVDRDGTLHRGALLLVLGRAGEALPLLRDSLRSHDDRADLWAAFADACHGLERADESNAAYVRALLLDPERVDPFRLRHPALAALLAELVAAEGEPCARELLLVHAWIAGLLAIPPENGWLDRHISRLQLAAAPRPDATREQRLRRFTLLFYLDRSRAPGEYVDAEREELQRLAPDLFARVMEHIQSREKRQTRSLRW